MRFFGIQVGRRDAAPETASDLVPHQKAAVSALSFRDVFGFARESFAGAWQRNVTIDNKESILAFSAVYACVSRISTDIAKLRLKLVEARDDGTLPEAVKSSPYWAVLRKPNHYQNRIQFLIDWLCSKLLHGNTYVLRQRDKRGIVVALYVLNPRLVTPLVTEDGDVYYRLSSDKLARLSAAGVTVPASEVIHDRHVTLWHPLCGVSPIYACGMSATQANRIQRNSAIFFENMSRPSGLLTAPDTIDDVTAHRLKTEWTENYSGNNLGKLAVLGDGLKYEAMTIPAEQAQLIEQLRWTVEDVARAFGVPLYKINAGPVPTSNNVEALDGQYYTGCLQVLIESIELCLDEGLSLPAALGYGVELDIDGLLRMDSATQIDVLSKAVGGAIMAPNEARRKIGLSPVAGGETPYLQEQNWPLQHLASREVPTREPTKPAEPVPAPAATTSEPAASEEEARAMELRVEKALGEHAEAIGRQLSVELTTLREANDSQRATAATEAADLMRAHAAEVERVAAEQAQTQEARAKQDRAKLQALMASELEKVRAILEQMAPVVAAGDATQAAEAMPVKADDDLQKFADMLITRLDVECAHG